MASSAKNVSISVSCKRILLMSNVMFDVISPNSIRSVHVQLVHVHSRLVLTANFLNQTMKVPIWVKQTMNQIPMRATKPTTPKTTKQLHSTGKKAKTIGWDVELLKLLGNTEISRELCSQLMTTRTNRDIVCSQFTTSMILTIAKTCGPRSFFSKHY